MADNKNFVGYVSVKETKYGNYTRVSFNEKDIQNLKDSLNEKGWVNVDIKESRGGKKYMEIDTWSPNRTSGGDSENIDIATPKMDDDEDLPF